MEPGEPILTFHDDWRVDQSAVLVAGGPVRIRYAKKRLLIGSDLSSQGPHSFNLTGYYRVGAEPEPVTSFDLGGRRSPSAGFAEQTITLPPNARTVELWFQRGGLYGSPRYDSNFGRNFVFDVFPVLDVSGPLRNYVAEIAEQGARTT
jgi:hypothetical protein